MNFQINPYFNLNISPLKTTGETFNCGKKNCCKKFKKGKRCKKCPARAKMV